MRIRRIPACTIRVLEVFASRREADIGQCLDGFELVSIVPVTWNYMSLAELRPGQEREARITGTRTLKEEIMKRLIHEANGI
jgi:hypothetical protein